MKRLLAVLLASVSISAMADNEFAYMPNQAEGSIFFTHSKCVYVSSKKVIPNNFYVYTTDKYGNKGSDGCYEYKYPFYLVHWNSGGRLSVHISQVELLK